MTRFLQCKREFQLTDQLLKEVLTIQMPLAGKNSSAQYFLEEKWMKKASSVIVIKNDDQRCLARATVVALAHLLHKQFLEASARTGSHLNPPKPQWIGNDPLLNALWKRHAFMHATHREPRQLLLAKMLISAAGYPDRKCGSRAWRRLQDRYLTP